MLKGATELSKALSDAAERQHALASKDASDAQEKFIALLDPPKKGKYDGAFKAKAGSRDSDSENPVKSSAPRES